MVHPYGVKSLRMDSSSSPLLFRKMIYSSIPESHRLYATLRTGEKTHAEQAALPGMRMTTEHVLVHHVSSIKEKDRVAAWKKNHLEQGHHEELAKRFYVARVKIAETVTLL